MAKRKKLTAAERRKQFVDYWEQLHFALEREISTDPPKGRAGLHNAIRLMEDHLRGVPNGEQTLWKTQQACGIHPEVEISFTVQGHCTQYVEITDKKLTVEKLRAGLRSGKYVTTIQEGGQVMQVRPWKVVGYVRSCDPECAYEDFEVEYEG